MNTKTLFAILLAVFACFSPVAAQKDNNPGNFRLFISRVTEERVVLEIDLAPGSDQNKVWRHMFSDDSPEAYVALERGITYQLIVTSLPKAPKAGRVSEKYKYPVPAIVAGDTLLLLSEARVLSCHGKTESDADGPSAKSAPAAKAAPAVLKATPPDSLLGPTITPGMPRPLSKEIPSPTLITKKPWESPEWGNILPAVQDAILLARGKCELEVVNETANVFSFQVGHLWWKSKNGLIQDQSGFLYIDSDAKHVIVRNIWDNRANSSRTWEDRYPFSVPRGETRRKIRFGGLQTGRVNNQCSVDIKVTTPVMPSTVLVLNNTARDNVQSMTGRQIFIVYFGPDFRRFVQIPGKIDDKPADNQVQTVEEINGNRIVRIKRVDFICTVYPSDLLNARELPEYEPAPR